MEEQANDEAIPLEVTSKPIKKRVVVQDDRDRDDYDAFQDNSYRRKKSSSHESTSIESKARRELLTYLSNKGIDATREVQNFEVHVKQPKNERHSDSWRSSTIITYTSPDGEVYTSKADVLDALKASRSRNALSQSNRADIAAAAQKKFSSFVRDGLPADVDSIKVLNFGVIDSDNSSFHNCVEIYPLGYRIELNHAERGRSNNSSKFVCEISSRNSHPDFRITTMSTGQTVSASTEASAWRKLDLHTDHGFIPSFFNLQVELLIEGMVDADLCVDYKFHAERGFPESYSTQAESNAAKQAYLSKYTTDMRKDPYRREERDRLSAAEKDRREQDKESSKRKRESDKETRNRVRLDVAQSRESKKLMVKNTKETKEESKKRRGVLNDKNKVRGQYRKDFSAELKRIRGDANVSVLQYFDEEENREEQEQHVKHPETLSGTSSLSSSASAHKRGVQDSVASDSNLASAQMEEFFRSLPSCDKSFFGMNSEIGEGGNVKEEGIDGAAPGCGTVGSGVEWDDVFQATNCLYAFNEFLRLQMPMNLNSLVGKVARVTDIKAVGASNQNADLSVVLDSDEKVASTLDAAGANATPQTNSAPCVEGKAEKEAKEDNDEEEDEWDESDYKSKNTEMKTRISKTEISLTIKKTCSLVLPVFWMPSRT